MNRGGYGRDGDLCKVGGRRGDCFGRLFEMKVRELTDYAAYGVRIGNGIDRWGFLMVVERMEGGCNWEE